MTCSKPYACMPIVTLKRWSTKRRLSDARVRSGTDPLYDNRPELFRMRTFKVKADDTILYHVAVGIVCLILCQWAKHLGATVIDHRRQEIRLRL